MCLSLLLPELVDNISIPQLAGWAKFGSRLNPRVVWVWIHKDNSFGRRGTYLFHSCSFKMVFRFLTSCHVVSLRGEYCSLSDVSGNFLVTARRCCLWNSFAIACNKEPLEVAWAAYPSVSTLPHVILCGKNPKVALTKERYRAALWRNQESGGSHLNIEHA